MQMTPLFGVGAALVILGAIILWRDYRKDRRRATIANGPGHDTVYDHISMADVEITNGDGLVVAAPPAPASERSSGQGTAQKAVRNPALSELQATIDHVHEELAVEDLAKGERSQKTEADWLRLQPRIDATVEAINAVLSEVSVQIAPAGQNGWSFNNRGFGAFRRVMLADESVAWLRMELTGDNRFICALRSHGDEKSALNADESVAAIALSDQRMAGLISASMQPITKYAARNASKIMSARDAGKTLWQESEELVTEALTSAASALEESGSSLDVFKGAQWDAANNRHRLTVDVMFESALVAKMHIDRPSPKHIECQVIPTATGATQLLQRQKLAIEGLQVIELAELFVNCAWPSIEHAWNAKHHDSNMPA